MTYVYVVVSKEGLIHGVFSSRAAAEAECRKVGGRISCEPVVML